MSKLICARCKTEDSDFPYTLYGEDGHTLIKYYKRKYPEYTNKVVCYNCWEVLVYDRKDQEKKQPIIDTIIDKVRELDKLKNELKKLHKCNSCHGLFKSDSITTIQYDKGQKDYCFNCDDKRELRN